MSTLAEELFLLAQDDRVTGRSVIDHIHLDLGLGSHCSWISCYANGSLLLTCTSTELITPLPVTSYWTRR